MMAVLITVLSQFSRESHHLNVYMMKLIDNAPKRSDF